MIAEKENNPREGQYIEKLIEKELPYPPSDNRYYGSLPNGRKYLSQEGKSYRQAVRFNMFGVQPLKGKLKMHIDVYPPDRRIRDIANLHKAIQDSLTYSGVIRDDFDIDYISTRRCEVFDGGKVVITIEPYVFQSNNKVNYEDVKDKRRISNVTAIKAKKNKIKKGVSNKEK